VETDSVRGEGTGGVVKDGCEGTCADLGVCCFDERVDDVIWVGDSPELLLGVEFSTVEFSS
jgi:hypothetical protein